tara:strand:+ start:32243 stop:33001 length:759 start_codon:yes stop_codon:yes gene_type:complete
MRDINKYKEDYVANQKFEDVLVKYRRIKSIEFLKKNNPRQVIELGCATESAIRNFVKNNEQQLLKRNFEWIIIEPNQDFIDINKSKCTYSDIKFYNNFFEDVNIEMLKITSSTCIICDGLLHEVPDLEIFMNQLKLACDFGAKCHLSVPNSNSLHRIIGKEMNMINELTDLSERNKVLQQHAVFSMNSLKDEINKYGLFIEDEGGFFIKPFTHNQMESIDFLDNDILDGLYKSGEKYPEISAEIFVNFSSKN